MAEALAPLVVLILIACVLLWANLKAGSTWLKMLTLWPALGLLAYVAWHAVEVSRG